MSATNLTQLLTRATLLRCSAEVAMADRVRAEHDAKRCDPLVRRALAAACGEEVMVQYEVTSP